MDLKEVAKRLALDCYIIAIHTYVFILNPTLLYLETYNLENFRVSHKKI